MKDTGRQTFRQPLCSIDAKHGLILLRILEGVIKLIYIKDLSSKESSSRNLEAYNVKYVNNKNEKIILFNKQQQKKIRKYSVDLELMNRMLLIYSFYLDIKSQHLLSYIW